MAIRPGTGLSEATLDRFELKATGGVLTADGTEQNLYIEDAPIAVVDPKTLFVDLDAMQVGDATAVKVYYRIASGGSWLLYDFQGYANANGGLTNGRVLISIDLLQHRYGLRVTLQQTAGANRSYPWQAIYGG